MLRNSRRADVDRCMADDVSGAAELAGLAAARGWRAEVQTRFDASSGADVIALDADTRQKKELEQFA